MLRRLIPHLVLLALYVAALASSLLVFTHEVYLVGVLGLYEGCLQRLLKASLMLATLVALPFLPLLKMHFLMSRTPPFVPAGAISACLWTLYISCPTLFKSLWYMPVAATVELLVLDYYLWRTGLALRDRVFLLTSLLTIAHQLYEVYFVYFKLLLHELWYYKLWQILYLIIILTSCVSSIASIRRFAAAVAVLATANLLVYLKTELPLHPPSPLHIVLALCVRLSPLPLLLSLRYGADRVYESFVYLTVLPMLTRRKHLSLL